MISTLLVGKIDLLVSYNLDFETIKNKIGLAIRKESLDILSVSDLKNANTLLGLESVDAILVTSELPDMTELIEYCFSKYIAVYSLNKEFVSSYPCEILFLNNILIYKIQRLLVTGWNKFIKRSIDILGSLVAIIVFSPFLIILSILVKVTSPGPIIFPHSRLGILNKPIKIYKFRSMAGNAEQILKELLANNPAMREEYETTYKLKDDPRVTFLGKLMRKTSMDELPQFFNVLKGDISLVGPRPVVKSEITKYGDVAQELLRVKPGLTGLWQVSGRNDLEYSERVKLDMYYIKHWSVWLDIKILFQTVPAVLFRKGAR